MKQAMRNAAFFALITLTACGGEKAERQKTTNNLSAIAEKQLTYLNLISEVQDEFGFVESDHCDSLLFSGLARFGGASVSILAARDEASGQWFRTPFMDCYKNERSNADRSRRSSSTISRDMLVGALWALYGDRNDGALKEMIAYGKRHRWLMGQGSFDRVFFTPNFQDTLYRLVGRTFKGMPYAWIDPKKDHQRHIVALNILLRGELEAKIDGSMLRLIKSFRKQSPKNALYQYAYHRFTDGDQAETIALLTDSKMFPVSRLPTSRERCGRWLWERDERNKDWRPCAKNRTHSGGDFIFLAKLLIDSAK